MLELDESINAKDAWLKQVKHHRKRLKGLPRVGFNPDAGNVEYNISMMNKMLGSGEMLSNNPVSGPFGGDVSSGASIGESLNNNINDRGFTMIDEIRQYVLELVEAEFETGHVLSEDYRTFKKLVAEDGYRATKTMYDFYLECRALGPAGFLEEYRDELDFDSDFVLEYSEEDDVIEESLTEMTNMEKLRNMYPELAESYDKEGNHEKCEECGALLNDAGECPRCVHGDEDVSEQLNESTLNEGPFDIFKKKSVADTVDKAQGNADKAKSKLRKDLTKIISYSLKDKGNTFLVDGEWITYDEFIRKYNPNSVSALMQTGDDLASAELNDTQRERLLGIIDTVVKNKEGFIIRRGLEVFKPGQVIFSPTRADLLKIKDGYRAEDIINVSQPNAPKQEEPKADNQDKEQSNENPQDNSAPNASEEPDAPTENKENASTQSNPEEEPNAQSEDEQSNQKPRYDLGVSDKTYSHFLKLAYMMKPKIFDAFNKEVLLNSIQDMSKIKYNNLADYQIELNGKKMELVDWMKSAVKNKVLTEMYDDSINYEEINIEETDLEEGLTNDEMQELIELGKEIGLKTLGDVEDFAKREAEAGESMLDALRRYRDDLGDDFTLRESFDISPKSKFEDSDEIDISWFNR